MRVPPNQEEAEQVKRFRRFLRPLAAVVLFFAVFNGAVGVAKRNGRFGGISVAMLLYFAATFVARRFTDKGRIAAAASVIAYGTLLIVSIATFLFPVATDPMVISALVAVAIALPYIDGIRLRLVLAATYAVVLVLVARGFRPDPSGALPFWLEFFSVIGGAAATLYL